MGTVYEKRGSLWIAYFDASGRRQWKPTGFPASERTKATRLLEKTEAKIAALKAAGASGGDGTLRGYAEQTWLPRREKAEIATVGDDRARLEKWVLGRLGHMKMAEARPADFRALLAELRAESGLAQRTLGHIVGLLHKLFADAIHDGWVDSNPVSIPKEERPRKLDKDPRWRRTAVFAPFEAALLIADPRIEEHERVYNATAFFTGMRFPGEAGALRIGDLEAARPLDRLTIAQSYSSNLKRAKPTKTQGVRYVPVHRQLAPILAHWLAEGWEKHVGRKPMADDLLLPHHTGGPRTKSIAWKAFQRNLQTLGLRARRLYDTRRTFISEALAAGAPKHVLRWITHGPEGDIVDLYTTIPWGALCAAVDAFALPLGTVTGGVTATVEAPGIERGANHNPVGSSRTLSSSGWVVEGRSRAESGASGHSGHSDPGGYLRAAERAGMVLQ